MTKAKATFSTSAFSMIFVIRSLILFSSRHTFFLVLLLSPMHLEKSFTLFLISLVRFYFILSLAFLTSSLLRQYLCIPSRQLDFGATLCRLSFLYLSLAKNSWFIHISLPAFFHDFLFVGMHCLEKVILENQPAFLGLSFFW